MQLGVVIDYLMGNVCQLELSISSIYKITTGSTPVKFCVELTTIKSITNEIV